ncbi:MAG: FadR family transcriptional regulator [Firmicutes bacterium]|nr:FadR family transcriptional regulator [Bacillota bacterium]
MILTKTGRVKKMKPIPSAKRFRLVMQAIQDFIIEKELQPGDRLPTEMELSTALQVSRPSVREALKSLEVLGVIEIKAGDGMFVRSFSYDPIIEHLPYNMMFDRDDLDEVMDIRVTLELGYIAKAVEQITEKDLKQLGSLLSDMEQAVKDADMRAYVKADGEFHRVLYEPVGNNLLLKLLDIFWKLLQNAHDFAELADPDLEQSYDRHRKIYNAVANRDSKKAYMLLRDHFRFTQEHIYGSNRSKTTACLVVEHFPS